MNPNTALAVKIRMIQAIQSRGFRVHILQRGAAHVWDKKDPSREWGFVNLDRAYEGVMELSGESVQAMARRQA